MNDARREFATIAAKEPVPLARGALLIAKEEYPDLDIDEYLDKLALAKKKTAPSGIFIKFKPAPKPSQKESKKRKS